MFLREITVACNGELLSDLDLDSDPDADLEDEDGGDEDAAHVDEEEAEADDAQGDELEGQVVVVERLVPGGAVPGLAGDVRDLHLVAVDELGARQSPEQALQQFTGVRGDVAVFQCFVLQIIRR